MDWNWPAHFVTAGAALAGAVIGSIGSAVAQGILQSRRIQADERLAKKKFDYDRHQAVFKRRFELAEQVLADAYRFQSLMKYVRNGASFGSEGQTRKPDGHESDAIKHARDNYFVPIERLHAEDKFLSEMFARRTACRAHFGPDIDAAFSKFNMAIHRVRASSGMLAGRKSTTLRIEIS